MLDLIFNELENNWDEQLPQVERFERQVHQRRHGFDIPTWSIYIGCHASVSRFSSVLESSVTRVWPAATYPTATWRRATSGARTISSANTAPSPFLA